MLARVLLHVVEAPIPIQSTLRLGFRRKGSDTMRNSFSFIHDVEQRNITDPSPVRRLPARFRIEGGPVKI